MRRTALAAALIPCAFLLTACGSSAPSAGSSTSVVSGSSNAGLSQAQLLARFKTALATVTALHIKGGTTTGSSPFSMDMQINKDGSAEGTIVSTGMTMPLVVVGGVTYVQITPSLAALMKSEAGADAAVAAKLVAGKWISSKSAIGSSMTQGMDSMTNFAEMTKQLGTASGDTFTYLDTSTVDGQQVAQYKDVSANSGSGSSTSGSSVSTLDVPLNGTALPIEESGSSEGTVTFTWNEPTKVAAPTASDIVNLPAS
ncbi:MAG TPA: hypothetical protein VFN97_22730 [Actinospica sp.]|nr:hypothetical protein [Actinospica sp.]